MFLAAPCVLSQREQVCTPVATTAVTNPHDHLDSVTDIPPFGKRLPCARIIRRVLAAAGKEVALQHHAREGKMMRIEDLVAEVTPHARQTLPADVKANLLDRINVFMEQAEDHGTVKRRMVKR